MRADIAGRFHISSGHAYKYPRESMRISARIAQGARRRRRPRRARLFARHRAGADFSNACYARGASRLARLMRTSAAGSGGRASTHRPKKARSQQRHARAATFTSASHSPRRTAWRVTTRKMRACSYASKVTKMRRLAGLVDKSTRQNLQNCIAELP